MTRRQVQAMGRVLTKVWVERDRPGWVQPREIIGAMYRLDALADRLREALRTCREDLGRWKGRRLCTLAWTIPKLAKGEKTNEALQRCWTAVLGILLALMARRSPPAPTTPAPSMPPAPTEVSAFLSLGMGR